MKNKRKKLIRKGNARDLTRTLSCVLVTSATVTARMGSPEDAKTNMNNAVGLVN